MRRRHLAGPETIELHTALQLLDFRVETNREILRGDHDLVLALQPVGGGLGELHGEKP
jgi:hypothetical protein